MSSSPHHGIPFLFPHHHHHPQQARTLQEPPRPEARGPRPRVIPPPSPPAPGEAGAVAPGAPAVAHRRAPAPPGDPGVRPPPTGASGAPLTAAGAGRREDWVASGRRCGPPCAAPGLAGEPGPSEAPAVPAPGAVCAGARADRERRHLTRRSCYYRSALTSTRVSAPSGTLGAWSSPAPGSTFGDLPWVAVTEGPGILISWICPKLGCSPRRLHLGGGGRSACRQVGDLVILGVVVVGSSGRDPGAMAWFWLLPRPECPHR